MKDADSRNPGNRKMNRRWVLGLAATATGSAALVWLNKDRTETQQTDAEPTEPAAQTTGASSSSVAASTTPPESQITALVGEEGFDIRIGSVHVFAPGGVAAPGTRISVSTPNEPAPTEFAAFSSAVGQPVRVVLGDGQQPQQPVTIVFDLRDTELSSTVSDETPLAVISRWEDSETQVPMTGIWDADDQTLTVVADHLSWFWPLLLDLDRVVTDFLNDLLGLQYPRPECAYTPLTVGTAEYSVAPISDDVVWPCLGQDNGQIVVELHSNSILPWAVKTIPSVSGTVAGSFKDSGPALAAIYQGLFGLFGDQRSVVMPGDTTSFRFNPSNPPQRVGIKMEPGLFMVSTLLWMVEFILSILFKGGGRKPDAVIASVGALDCFTEIINTSYEITDDQQMEGIVTSTLTCIQELFEDAPALSGKLLAASIATVVGMLVSGAGFIAGYAIAAMRELTDTDTFTFTISQSTTAQEDGELYALHIRADNTDTGETTFGAQFTVTTEDGAYLGTCTLEGDENSPPWQYCAVDVPKGIVVSVWEDPETLPDGYAPEENPLTFDTTFPTTTPHKIDVSFDNVPQHSTSPGQAEPFEAFVGEWGRHTGLVTIESDGTGELSLYSGCCTGVTYSLEFDVDASPVTATIVSRSFEGDMDPTESAQPEETITFGFEPGQNGDLLVVNLPASEQRFVQRLEFCAPDEHDERCGA